MYQHRSKGFHKSYGFSSICGNRGLYPFGTDEIKHLYMISVSHPSLHYRRDTEFADNGEV